MDKSTVKQAIQKHFPMLNQHELVELLAKRSNYLEIPAKQEILHTGSYIKVVPLVLSGSVKVSREDEEGRELFLYYIKEGESCAATLSACMNMERSSVSAITQEESRILAVPAELVYDIYKRYPSWQLFVSHTYAQRFNELLQVLENVVFQRMDERLAKYLLDKSIIMDKPILIISHQEIANDLGTSREVISRLLKQFEKRGYLLLSRGKIKIEQIPPLEHLAYHKS
ncbi:MAG TPA: Crp/Fnr family transcriptional regulator [Phaeodactylibacter sp.]|nr:Crp/Fnr family transcriptional regulator [Phaeodactylibacter sp.]